MTCKGQFQSNMLDDVFKEILKLTVCVSFALDEFNGGLASPLLALSGDVGLDLPQPTRPLLVLFDGRPLDGSDLSTGTLFHVVPSDKKKKKLSKNFGMTPPT